MRKSNFKFPSSHFTRIRLLAFASALSLFLSGCTATKDRGDEQRYVLKGKVISVNKPEQTAAIDHEPVPGLMDAMVMDFKIKDKDALDVMEPGAQIQATLVVADEGSWLENPVITKAIPGGAPSTTNPEPEPGRPVPDFALVNQDEKPVNLNQYRGRALLLTFIYTRCPLADYCPLVSQRFAALLRDINNDSALKDKARLLSVSIDPQYDTPKVLRSYGGAYTENYGDEKFETWQFATGDVEEVKKLALFFGMDYFADKEQIVHTLRTVVIDSSGRVKKIYRGNDWQLSEVLDELRKASSASDSD